MHKHSFYLLSVIWLLVNLPVIPWTGSFLWLISVGLFGWGGALGNAILTGVAFCVALFVYIKGRHIFTTIVNFPFIISFGIFFFRFVNLILQKSDWYNFIIHNRFSFLMFSLALVVLSLVLGLFLSGRKRSGNQ